jgi:hypothetical protein
MSAPARTKADANRALSQADIVFLGELEVVNAPDLRALTSFLTTLLRKEEKTSDFCSGARWQAKTIMAGVSGSPIVPRT